MLSSRRARAPCDTSVPAQFSAVRLEIVSHPVPSQHANPLRALRVPLLAPRVTTLPPPVPYSLASCSCSHDGQETLIISPDKIVKLMMERTARRGIDPPALNVQHVRELLREHIKHLTAESALSRPAHSLFACPVRECILVVDGNQKAYCQQIAGDDRAQSLPLATGERGTNHFFPTEAALDGLVRQCAEAHGAKRRPADSAAQAACCSSELKAASNDGKRGKDWLKISGLFVLACCHSMVLKGMPFSGGEKAIYPFVLYLLNGVKSAMLCGDTMCRCKQCRDALATLKDIVLPAGQADFATMNVGALLLCVNAMHVWGVRRLSLRPSRTCISRRAHSQ